MNKKDQELYDKFVKYATKNMAGSQIDKSLEELFELGTAIIHYKEGKTNIEDLIQEIADVENMLGQIKDIYEIDQKKVDEQRIFKIKKFIKKFNPDL